MRFASVWEAFGCVVLKDAAGLWPKPGQLHRLLRVQTEAEWERSSGHLWWNHPSAAAPPRLPRALKIRLTAARMLQGTPRQGLW